MANEISPEQALDIFRQVAEKYTASGADHAVIRQSLEVLAQSIAGYRTLQQSASQKSEPAPASEPIPFAPPANP